MNDERYELAPPHFRPLPLGAIRPKGWLARQLRIQADGLSGHLDEFWPDIQNSRWFGGDTEGWERAPYWLDGVIPLAYLLDDDAAFLELSPLAGWGTDDPLGGGSISVEPSRSFKPFPRVLF